MHNLSARADTGTARIQDLSDEVFDLVAKLAYEDFALKLDESKRSMVFRRLSPRLKKLGIDTFEDYADVLQRNSAERGQLLSMLTTNLTGFYRENHHFELLAQKWLPRLVDAAKKGRRVRLWSAACSSGPEPYSLAMTVLEACPDAAQYDIKILATDIDPEIIVTAQHGAYDVEKLKSVPRHQLRNFFVPVDNTQQAFLVSDSVKSLISFGQLNLAGEWPFSGTFDAIFCRNVAIYFETSVQETLWARLSDRLTPGGLLCIGHSERISGPADKILEPLGKTAYARR